MSRNGSSRYPALRIIAAWYKVFGYVVGAIIALAGLVTLFTGDDKSFGIGLLVGAIIFIVLSVAVAEVIQVFLDTESNTRSTADLLQQLIDIEAKEKKQSLGSVNNRRVKKPRSNIAKQATADQAKSIRALIKNLNDDGMSLQDIAQELRTEGMPTLDGTAAWTEEAVRQILNDS